jgi:hypothetical protein
MHNQPVSASNFGNQGIGTVEPIMVHITRLREIVVHSVAAMYTHFFTVFFIAALIVLPSPISLPLLHPQDHEP